jgi:ketosteroid isomerase-like protein
MMQAEMRVSWRRALPALFLLVFPGVLRAQSGRSWVTGIVVGVSASQGLAGAVIEMTANPGRASLRDVSFKAVTDENGRYVIKNIPYGGYTLKVSAPGYLSYEIPVYILSDAETRLHARLRMEREEQEEIQRQFLRYQRALSSRDAETIGDLYTAEAVSLLQNQPPRKGREAIAARWKQSFGANFSLVLTSAEILLSPGGQDACQYGMFEIHSTAAGAALLASGKWTYVWRKEADVWRIALEMDNFDSRKE